MASTVRYAALLRGINVGGRNKISMADLRALFEEAGYGEVGTYIQSGNVVFETDSARTSLESDIEALLREHLETPPVVVVRSHPQMRAVVNEAPVDFAARAEDHHRDVVFLKDPLTAEQAMGVVQTREGVDEAWPGPGVVYFTRLIAEKTKSRMNRIVGTPQYRLMTIRNWATTTRMLSLLDAMS
ncbi:uncharacterized protein (DUF1697 family) [Mycolicibacterium iranicum]|uniref:Uncharacterized protein (DUF1697 family) n=1 Tax=Mycolicibacterium iranicum TaxID=912594 RepID=A0A839Q0D0_MYCIR|nr:DUF1697 domain-containing protein [Mycolicibacterium iranicum]MBB2989219.1 uncharacterized protein (DUF1697 family) [Mycolicibacterium iranicum]